MRKVKPTYRRITRQRYNDWRTVLPVCYVESVDDQPVQKGIAVCEAQEYNARGVELTVCFRKNGRYYETIANLSNNSGFVRDYAGRAGTKGYRADTRFRTALYRECM